jgi:hypothetical protein
LKGLKMAPARFIFSTGRVLILTPCRIVATANRLFQKINFNFLLDLKVTSQIAFSTPACLPP